MNSTAIFWPMILHVALVFAVYTLLNRRRIQAITAGEAKASDFRENLGEPPTSLLARNSLNNQFELPPLFHIACLCLYVTGGAGIVAVVVAWVFALSRVLHAGVHVTSNRLRYRRPAFVVGLVTVALLWILLAVHLATA